jgi:hypothetical protein
MIEDSLGSRPQRRYLLSLAKIEAARSALPPFTRGQPALARLLAAALHGLVQFAKTRRLLALRDKFPHPRLRLPQLLPVTLVALSQLVLYLPANSLSPRAAFLGPLASQEESLVFPLELAYSFALLPYLLVLPFELLAVGLLQFRQGLLQRTPLAQPLLLVLDVLEEEALLLLVFLEHALEGLGQDEFAVL